MKLLTLVPILVVSLGSALPMQAAETLIVPYSKTWDYIHPMGRNPALNDADFDSTWWLSSGQFAEQYNGPSFTESPPYIPSDITSINSGSGPGPLGYGSVDSLSLLVPFGGGLPITSLGTTLTTPFNPNRKGSYYRTTFTTSQTLHKPVVRAMIDDGCVIFLDGVQVARLNLSLPDNNAVPSYTSFALGDGTLLEVPESTENTLYTVDLSVSGNHGTPGGLQANVINPVFSIPAGTHTLAVFLCSFSATNSDQLMALQMTGDDASINPQLGNLTRNLSGTPSDLADDTFEFDVNVTALSAGNNGWSSDSLQHPAGDYSRDYHFSGFPVTSAATIGFRDADIPTLNATLTVQPPSAPLWIGQNELPGQISPLVCTADTSSEWVQSGDESIQQNDGDGTVRQMQSTVVSLPPGGAVFGAILEFEESSTGDNFEAEDTLEALLRLNDGVSLLEIGLIPAALDVNSDGKLNGYTGSDYNDRRLSDEYNLAARPAESVWTEGLALSYQIPPGMVSAQFIVRATNNAATETFRVRNVLFTTILAPLDRDLDAVTDADELAAGTDPLNSASRLSLTSTRLPGTVLLSFPTATNRTYRILSTGDLVNWVQENNLDITGDGGVQEFAYPESSVRKFFTLQVRRELQPFP